jgi:hypothetical protein
MKISRKIIQHEIEEAALANETDKASKEQLERVRNTWPNCATASTR